MTITTSRPAPLDIDALRSRFSGWVIGPADPDYDAERTVLPGGIDSHPAVIVRVAGTDDVREVIALARETGHELAVRAGGHSAAAHSTVEGGIVLDVRDLDSFDIDVEGRTAWAGAGLTALAYTKAADEHDLATGFGDTGSVGIAGLTLGGGIGYLVRRDGLAIDNLLAAEIVTADGEVHVVDAEHEPDLFWAIRGGGGNLGVATRFHYRLHPVTEVTGGMLVLPGDPRRGRRRCADPGRGPRHAVGDPQRDALPADAVRARGVPRLHRDHGAALLRRAARRGGAGPGPGPGARRAARRHGPPHPLPGDVPAGGPGLPPDGGREELLPRHVRRAEGRGGPRADRGAHDVADPGAPAAAAGRRLRRGSPDDATAYAHRGHRFMANVAAFYAGPDDLAEKAAWVDDLGRVLEPAPGAYVNFIADEGEARVHDAYPPATWERLARIKRRYDPDNLFHRNQNVPPAEG